MPVKPRVLRITIDRKSLPGEDETAEQVAADDVFGVEPQEAFPGIIFETMLYEWTSVSMEYDRPFLNEHGLLSTVKRYHAENLDESGRADLIRSRRRSERRG